MKKFILLLGIISFLTSCQTEKPKSGFRQIDKRTVVFDSSLTGKAMVDTFLSKVYIDSLAKDADSCLAIKLNWSKEKSKLIEENTILDRNLGTLIGSIQFFVLIFSALFLFMLWVHYETSIAPKLELIDEKKCNNDYGLPLLALALLFWGMVSLNGLRGKEAYSGVMWVFSAMANGFFLVATTLFDHGVIKSQKRKKIGVSIFFTLTVALIFIYLLPILSKESNARGILDFIFTMFALSMLGVNLGKSFKERDLPVLVVVSWLTIAFCIFAQIVAYSHIIWGDDGLKGFFAYSVWNHVLHIVSQVAMCSLLIALAFSWINEKSAKLTRHETYFELNTLKNYGQIDIESSKSLLTDAKELIAEDKTLEAYDNIIKVARPFSWIEYESRAIEAISKFNHSNKERHIHLSNSEHALCLSQVNSILIQIIVEMEFKLGKLRI